MRKVTARAMGVAVAMAFIILTSIRLDHQGPYYDELHQGPAAFRYIGKHPRMLTLQFNDIPILNMTYSGALKSFVYGLYLRYVHHHFTVYSWRLCGILFVAIGLCAFYWIAGRLIPWTTGVLFAGLMLTDATILLNSRYDWGPTALALALRLVLIAIWISIELSEPTTLKRFASGLITGIAIFEKLVAVVLLGPLFLMLSSRHKVEKRGLIATLSGVLLGALPLAYANYSSYKHGAGLVSLSQVTTQPNRLRGVWEYGTQLFALGHGDRATFQVLGSLWNPLWSQTEAILIVTGLAIIGILALRQRHSNKLMFLAGILIVAYVLVGILLFVFPRETDFHHWIQATPFQYAAFALAAGASTNRRRTRMALFAVLLALFLVRLPNVLYVEWALVEGKSSEAFDPAFARLGEAAAARAPKATFIAADWGTAAQIYCMSDGDDDLVYETFWDADPAGASRLVMDKTRKKTLYVVTSGLTPQFDEAARFAIDAVATSTNWAEAPVEKELADLSVVKVRKFNRVE
jgi:hypothetical protein